MADPHKTRVGRHIRVCFRGQTYRGEFGGIIPADPYNRDPRKREERIIVKHGAIIDYVPNVEGTKVYVDRERRASSS